MCADVTGSRSVAARLRALAAVEAKLGRLGRLLRATADDCATPRTAPLPSYLRTTAAALRALSAELAACQIELRRLHRDWAEAAEAQAQAEAYVQSADVQARIRADVQARMRAQAEEEHAQFLARCRKPVRIRAHEASSWAWLAAAAAHEDVGLQVRYVPGLGWQKRRRVDRDPELVGSPDLPPTDAEGGLPWSDWTEDQQLAWYEDGWPDWSPWTVEQQTAWYEEMRARCTAEIEKPNGEISEKPFAVSRWRLAMLAWADRCRTDLGRAADAY